MIIQHVTSVATFGLVGAMFALPASFFIYRTHRLNKGVILFTVIATMVGAIYGAFRHVFNTPTALGASAGYAIFTLESRKTR